MRGINDRDSECRVTAERAMLARLDGSCRTPIAGLAEILLGGKQDCVVNCRTTAHTFSADETGSMDDPATLGMKVGEALIAQAGPDYKVH